MIPVTMTEANHLCIIATLALNRIILEQPRLADVNLAGDMLPTRAMQSMAREYLSILYDCMLELQSCA
jgi:hypothetical protein